MVQGGIQESRIKTVKPGDSMQIEDVEIQVFDSHDPDAPGAITYLLRADGVTLFLSCDTRDGITLDEVGAAHTIDLALLALGAVYMRPQQLMAAQKLNPKVLLPFHWETWRGWAGNPLELGKLIALDPPPFQVRLLQMGEHISYQSGHGIFEASPEE